MSGVQTYALQISGDTDVKEKIVSCPLYKFQSVTEAKDLLAKLSCRETDGQNVDSQVQNIISDVQLRKDAALIEYTQKFDCPDFTGPIKVDFV